MSASRPRPRTEPGPESSGLAPEGTALGGLYRSCQTCGEGAVRAVVRRLVQEGAEVAAEVEDACGQRAEVACDFVPDVRVGDVLLVQAGVALGRAET